MGRVLFFSLARDSAAFLVFCLFFSFSAAATTARSPTPSPSTTTFSRRDKRGSFSSSNARAKRRAPSRSLEWSTAANGLGSARAFCTSAILSRFGNAAASTAAKYAADASADGSSPEPADPAPYASEGSHQPQERAWYATWNHASSKADASAIAQRCVTRASTLFCKPLFPHAVGSRWSSVDGAGPEETPAPIAAAARANASSSGTEPIESVASSPSVALSERRLGETRVRRASSSSSARSASRKDRVTPAARSPAAAAARRATAEAFPFFFLCASFLCETSNAATRASAAKDSSKPTRHHRRSRHVTPPSRAALIPPHSFAIARAIGSVVSACFGSRGAIGSRPNASRKTFDSVRVSKPRRAVRAVAPFASSARRWSGAHSSRYRAPRFGFESPKEISPGFFSPSAGKPENADPSPATPRRGRRVHPDARCAANTSVGSESSPSWSRTAAAADFASQTPSHEAGDDSTARGSESEGRRGVRTRLLTTRMSGSAGGPVRGARRGTNTSPEWR